MGQSLATITMTPQRQENSASRLASHSAWKLHYFPDGSLGFEPLRASPTTLLFRIWSSRFQLSGKKKKSLKQSQHNTWCDPDGANIHSLGQATWLVPVTVKHISGNILIMDINSSNSAEVLEYNDFWLYYCFLLWSTVHISKWLYVH